VGVFHYVLIRHQLKRFIPSADLSVIILQAASPRGIVAGLRPRTNGPSEIFKLIPAPSEIDKLTLSHIKWIVVVEKEVYNLRKREGLSLLTLLGHAQNPC